jgi:Tol biopolymer transport system component
VSWSPDGRFIAFVEGGSRLWHGANGRLTLLSIPLDGKPPTAVVRQRDASKSGARSDWATDGRRFFFTVPRYEGDVWTVEVR